MRCPNCGLHNTDDARFCSRCGTALAITCQVCGAESNAGAKFCSNCGSSLTAETPTDTGGDLTRYLPEELLSKLRSARAGRAMQGERRTVTMLFADIKGSTALAETMDPEDWAEIVNGAFEHLIAPVYRYEGTLARLQGDAVLAFFGAPIAHEDDPIRAVRAGLEIVDAMSRYRVETERRWDVPIDVRVGINTGLVVVGEVGSDLRVEYTALGDAINVAARMEQTAEPGTIRITAETLALTGGAFDVEHLGAVEVKGKSRPVPTYRVLRMVTAAPVGEDHPLVGRTQQLELLDGAVDSVVAGVGTVVSVIGEAGVGKTRLLHEFRTRTESRTALAVETAHGGDVAWMLGTNRSYDAETPFSTIGDLLRRWWDVDDPEQGFGKVEEAVRRAGIDDPDVAAYLAHIGGVTPSRGAGEFIAALATPALNTNAAAALLRYVRAEASLRPVLMTFEDLHWADDLSLSLIEGIMDAAEAVPIGLVVAMRPNREEPAWHIHEIADRDHHHRYVHIELDPLSEQESTALLKALVPPDTDLTDSIRSTILRRSDGNPLFIEEIARSMIELGGDLESQVPTSLGGMLTSRLDRLDDEAKLVAQTASVLGTVFQRDTLEALLDRDLEQAKITELLRRGVLTESRDIVGALAFRHALMQEAAYSTILRRTRRSLHKRVADHLISAQSDAVQEIARHLMEADEKESAFPYLVEAGHRAVRSMALADAIRLFSNAIDNAPEDANPDLVVSAHDGLGEAYSLVPDLSRSAAAFQRLYDYGERTSLPSVKVAALNRLGFATATLGADLEKALSFLDDARSLAEAVGDDLGLAQYHLNACYVASLGGSVEDALAHDEATVEVADKGGLDQIRMIGMIRRAVNYTALLDVEKAGPAVEEALEIARNAGMFEAEAILESLGLGMLSLAGGNLREALEYLEGAQPTLERYSSWYAPIGGRTIGRTRCLLGDLEGALSWFVASRRLAIDAGQPFIAGAAAAEMCLVYATAGMAGPLDDLRSTALERFQAPIGEFLASSGRASLGEANLLQGKAAEAQVDFEAGLAASSITIALEKPRLLGGLALARVIQGDHQGAREALDHGLASAHERGTMLYDALLAHVEGELMMAVGDFPRAGKALQSALETAMDGGQLMRLLQIRVSQARWAALSGTQEDVVRHLTQARSIVDTVAGSIADEDLRDTFSDTWTGVVNQSARRNGTARTR